MRKLAGLTLVALLSGLAPATSGELLSKQVCLRMGNTEASCDCADAHMKQTLQSRVSPRALDLLQKSDFKTLQKELSYSENQSLAAAMTAAHQAATDACNLNRE